MIEVVIVRLLIAYFGRDCLTNSRWNTNFDNDDINRLATLSQSPAAYSKNSSAMPAVATRVSRIET
jgi:hypothetical protein